MEEAMRVFIAVALAAAVLSGAASAGPAEERRQCLAREGISVEQKLAACTALIESGGETPQGLVAALISRGIAYHSKQNYDSAIQDYDGAIRIEPRNAIAFNNRGNSYQKKALPDRALQDYDQALRLNPKYALALVNRASVHRIKGRFDNAILDCDQAIAINPNFASAFFGRAIAYQDKARWDFDSYLSDGRYDQRAIEDYSQVIVREPTNAAA